MEKLYQYLWKHKMLGRSLRLKDGSEISVVSPGSLNNDAGPDFSNARIIIKGTLWVGNVEIHVKASDWLRHRHNLDKAYDNVILHVVAIDDATIRRSDGSVIPQTVVTFPEKFFSIYATLAENINSVRCRNLISSVSNLVLEDWLETLAVERMQLKANHILQIHKQSGGDWEKTCFITLARSLGFGLNGIPFELMAQSIPLNFLARHSDDLFQTEALLFGQAGMLDMSMHIFDEYYQALCREYYFLARKYNIRPIRLDLWKYAKTRPHNFPHRRIALLAKALFGGFSLMSKIIASKGNPHICRELFNWNLEGYWSNHSGFDIPNEGQPLTLSKNSIDLLLINMVAPLIYAHGAYLGNPDDAERGLNLWSELLPEKNSIIAGWNSLGINCKSAMRSQALIQLRKEYCDKAACLNCRFGNALLRNTIAPPKNLFNL